MLKRWADTARALERVIALSTDKGEQYSAHLALGRVLDEHADDPGGARRHYETALMVDPDQAWPYLAIAEMDLRGRRWSRAIAHVDHGLELCAPDAEERPWLLAIKGASMQQVSVSMGPVSTFFRGLRVPVVEVDPAEQALALASERLPELRARSPREWLDEPRELGRLIRDRMPRPSMPSWWFQG